MFPFTSEIFQPADRCHKPEAVERFFSDSIALRLRGQLPILEARCLEAALASRAVPAHGLASRSISAVPASGTARRQTQNSIIGNGFHLFTLLALFCMAPQVLSTKLPLELSCLEELALRERLTGTVCAIFHLAAPELLQAMRHCFADSPVEDEVWRTCSSRRT